MRLKALVLAAVMTLGMATTVFGAEIRTAGDGKWIQGSLSHSDTWWYENNDGTFLANTWAWIDGNGDGIAECYYFDQDGWMIYNAESTDHWVTNESGAWTLAGNVQTKQF